MALDEVMANPVSERVRLEEVTRVAVLTIPRDGVSSVRLIAALYDRCHRSQDLGIVEVSDLPTDRENFIGDRVGLSEPAQRDSMQE